MIGLGIAVTGGRRAGPPPIPSAPVNSGAPVIGVLGGGAPVVGAVLTVLSDGVWSGYPRPFARQWRVNGVDALGETGAEFDTAGLDEADEVDLRVSVTNGLGSDSELSNALTLAAAPPTALDRNVLFSGHSLVSTYMPPMMGRLKQDAGGTGAVDYSVIIGSSMVWRWEHAGEEQGVNARAVLAAGDTDVFIITEAGPIIEQINYLTFDFAPLWYDAFATANPTGRIILYATWAALDSGPGTELPMSDPDRLVPWRHRPHLDMPLWESIADHVNGLREPGQPEMFITPMGYAWGRLYDAIENGEITGYSWPGSFFGDMIHYNEGRGAYYVACLMYAMAYGLSPVGRTNVILDVYDQVLPNMPDAALALQLQTWAWEAVASYPRSGVTSDPFAPNVSRVEIGPAEPAVGAPIGLWYAAETGVPAPTRAYSWRIDGVEVATAATFTPLPEHEGHALSLRLTATNSEGSHQRVSPAKTVGAAAVTAPGAPAAPSVSASGPGALGVSWSAPALTGGSAITRYDLRISTTGVGGWTEIAAQTSPATITSRAPSTTYYVQVRAANAAGDGAWSASGSATTEAAAGGGLPWVAFDGSDYITGIAEPASGQATLAMRMRMKTQGNDANNIVRGLRFFGTGGAERFYFHLFFANYGQLLDGMTDGADGRPNLGLVPEQEYSLMFAIDGAGGLTGGRSLSIWVDGALLWGASVTGGDVLGFPSFMAGWDAGEATLDIQGVWISNSAALDPATHWGSFFDETGAFRSLTGSGVVGGASPHLWLAGGATAWNSGTDLAGNAFTMNGGVTDVGGGIALPVIADAGTIAGGGLIGASQSVTGFSASGADSTSYSWRANGVEVGTGPTFVPTEALDGQSLVRRTVASNGGGGVHADTPAVVIAYSAPTSAGDLSAVILTHNAAMGAAIDFAAQVTVSGDADLSGVTWSVSPLSDPLPDGLARSGGSIAAGTPAGIAKPRTITLRASNSGGFVDVSCPVTVRPEAAAAWWAPAMAGQTRIATAGTGASPVGAGDPIGHVLDASGAGLHLSAPNDGLRMTWAPFAARKAASSNQHVTRATVNLNRDQAGFSVVAAFQVGAGTPGAVQHIVSINDGATSGTVRVNLRLDTDGRLKALIRRADGGSAMTIDGGVCPTGQIVVATLSINYATNATSLQINSGTAVSGGALNGTSGANSANTNALSVFIGSSAGVGIGPAQTLDVKEVIPLNSASATAARDYLIAEYG